MKKKMVIITAVVAVVIIAGYGAIHFGVNFVFDRYVLNTTLSSIARNDGDEDVLENENAQPEATQSEQQDAPEDASAVGGKPTQTKQRLSNSEIIARVLRSSELTYKMASMVSYEDKKRVIAIVMSNFTADELTDIAKKVSAGMTSEYKSRMIAEARGRLTGGQWQECLNIAYKYIDQIRPYVE